RFGRLQKVALLLLLEGLCERGLALGLELIAFVLGDATTLDELLDVGLTDRGLLVDEPVHHGLREPRLVTFVVAVAAVAKHVDDDILAEALAELRRQA